MSVVTHIFYCILSSIISKETLNLSEGEQKGERVQQNCYSMMQIMTAKTPNMNALRPQHFLQVPVKLFPNITLTL